jgi:hypothetical protein
MVNSNYNLDGGMDTPSLAAEKRYEMGSEMFDADGRLSRDWRADQEGHRGASGAPVQLGGERNGRRKSHNAEEDMEVDEDMEKRGQQDNGWGSLVFGAISGVVVGAWAFCKKSAFRGFYAGGGQGYAIRPHIGEDPFGSEGYWEDEQEGSNAMSASMRSYERLSTPVPGEYPEDSPPEDNTYSHSRSNDIVERERRPAKRRQTDGGGWVVVDKIGRSRTSSPHLSTPANARIPHPRPHSTSLKRPILNASRSRHRISSGVSYTGSPAQPSHSRNTSYANPRSPGSAATGAPALKTSPPSVEAKKYAARKRKEEKVVGEQYDRFNDKLLEMIKQGKEALGSKIEVVEQDEPF